MLRSPSPVEAAAWPSLPLDSWRDTRDTLHMWTQIVGKTRLALAPAENHWWHVALYLTSRGLTTSPMPYGTRTLSAEFDFLDHGLHFRTSDGATGSVPLIPARWPTSTQTTWRRWARSAFRSGCGRSRSRSRSRFLSSRTGSTRPTTPRRRRRWWKLLVEADRVLKRFRGRFLGKASPVHFFWGSFDLAATRFSGRRAPPHPGHAQLPGLCNGDAYSHECSSCGFWFGSGPVAEPAFYSYAYPEPPGYADRPVRPEGASYNRDLGEFILPIEAVRTAADPEAAVLDFCQSTYEAAADTGRWDRAALELQAAPGA